MCIVAECLEMAGGFCKTDQIKPVRKSKWDMEQLIGGMIWILRTGAQWRSLPKEFPSRSTVHRWFQYFNKGGVFEEVLRRWLARFYEVFKPKSTYYIGRMFVEAKGGGVGNTKCGKGSKVMVLTNEDCIPCGIYIGSATPHEVNYVEDLLDAQFLPEHKVKKLVGDKAYDSDKYDKILLEEKGVELIAPHKKERVNFTQDKRKLKGYKKRHFVENLNAHL